METCSVTLNLSTLFSYFGAKTSKVDTLPKVKWLSHHFSSFTCINQVLCRRRFEATGADCLSMEIGLMKSYLDGSLLPSAPNNALYGDVMHVFRVDSLCSFVISSEALDGNRCLNAAIRGE